MQFYIMWKKEKVVIAADAEYEDYYDNNSQYDPSRLASFISVFRGIMILNIIYVDTITLN